MDIIILFILLTTCSQSLAAGNDTVRTYWLLRDVASSSLSSLDSYKTVNDIWIQSYCTSLCTMEEDVCLSVIFDGSHGRCLLFNDYQSTSLSIASERTWIIYHTNLLSDSYLSSPTREDCCFVDDEASASPLYQDCQAAFEAGDIRPGETYYLKPFDSWRVIRSVCEFDSDNGWTVIQRRLDGSVDFFRNYANYTDGFGDLGGEYWIGLEAIFQLTRRNRKLKVSMEDHEGNTRTASYNVFHIERASNLYKLRIAGYSGDAGNALDYHDRQRFSAYDFGPKSSACATPYKGGFWFRSCHEANPNGLWIERGDTEVFGLGIIWETFKGQLYSLKSISMKITN